MQRVAIGRAIVRRPRIFLMDEPLTNLDAKLRESLRVELVLLRRQLKTPMIFVTHDQAEALSMADRIVVLSAGGVLQTGTPQEVYCRPISPTVARQLGQPAINLFRLPFAGASHLADARGTLGVRPEDVRLTGGATAAPIELVEDMGPTQTILARWQGHEVRIVAPKDVILRVGDRIFPKIDPDRAIHWPDAIGEDCAAAVQR